MTVETVVGQDSSEIGVVMEVNTIHVKSFSFQPVGASVDLADRGEGLEKEIFWSFFLSLKSTDPETPFPSPKNRI